MNENSDKSNNTIIKKKLKSTSNGKSKGRTSTFFVNLYKK